MTVKIVIRLIFSNIFLLSAVAQGSDELYQQSIAQHNGDDREVVLAVAQNKDESPQDDTSQDRLLTIEELQREIKQIRIERAELDSLYKELEKQQYELEQKEKELQKRDSAKVSKKDLAKINEAREKVDKRLNEIRKREIILDQRNARVEANMDEMKERLEAQAKDQVSEELKGGGGAGSGGGEFEEEEYGDYSESEKPTEHTWDTIFSGASELEGYGLYTYVLFQRKIDEDLMISDSFVARLSSLLEAILVSTPHDSTLDSNVVSLSERNLFCIPGKVFIDESNYLESYDTDLSMNYLAQIRKNLGDDDKIRKKLNNPGPFLISSPLPLRYYKSDVPLLVADLSRTNPDAMHEVVRAYKIRVSRDSLEDTNIFKSIRLSILNFVLNADEDLAIVKVALAGWTND